MLHTSHSRDERNVCLFCKDQSASAAFGSSPFQQLLPLLCMYLWLSNQHDCAVKDICLGKPETGVLFLVQMSIQCSKKELRASGALFLHLNPSKKVFSKQF